MVHAEDRGSQRLRSAQMLQDAAVQLTQLPSSEDFSWAAARPVAVVGSGDFRFDLLRSWIGQCHPVVISTHAAASGLGAAGIAIDVVVGEPDSLASPLPADVRALLAAQETGSSLITTWGIATYGSQLRELSREQAGQQLAALLAADVPVLPGEVFVCAAPRPSIYGGIAIAAAALIAGISVLALSDPGLSLVHRIF